MGQDSLLPKPQHPATQLFSSVPYARLLAPVLNNPHQGHLEKSTK